MSTSHGFKCCVLGPPCSGKTTLAEKMKNVFPFQHIACGRLIRRHIKQQTALGREAEKQMGNFIIADNLVIQMMGKEIGKVKNDPLIISGYPQNLNQCTKFWEAVKIDVAVNLIVPFDVLVDRVRSRWYHQPSGRQYNLLYNPPKNPFKDDETGEPLVQRDEDKLGNFFKLLRDYEGRIGPVLDFYRAQAVLMDFKGKTTEEVFEKIKHSVENFIPPKQAHRSK